MSSSKIKPEDISVLIQILGLEGTAVIYDPQQTLAACSLFNKTKDIATLLKSAPQHKICINLSGRALEVFTFDYIIEFEKSIRSYRSFHAEKFLAINNPDGTIRWFLPHKSNRPDFLALYNNSGLKATLFKIAARFAYRLGFKNWICKNAFVLYAKETDYFSKKFGQEAVAIFTGTVGQNRKAVAALCRNGLTSHYVKIPISSQSRHLILNESEHLKTLEKHDFKHFRIPRAKMSPAGLKLDNIRPRVERSVNTITDFHITALRELYANTFQLKPLSDLKVYTKTCENLEAIKQCLDQQYSGGIERKKVERLAYNIKVLLSSFKPSSKVAVAYAHGDFTPWNMYMCNTRIHVYDWELAERAQLMLYDIFHFVFQSGILIQRASFQQIKKNVLDLKKTPLVDDIIERYHLDFRDCYHWYLICNCSYYLNLYIHQEHLHQQAHWLIDTWIKASNNAILSETKKTLSFATV